MFLKATAESHCSVLDENCPSKNFADEQLSLLVGLLTKRSSMQQRQIYQRRNKSLATKISILRLCDGVAMTPVSAISSVAENLQEKPPLSD